MASGVRCNLHPEIRFEMLERDDTAFQRVSFFDWQFEVPMQLIMGSSKMAETYLYWHGEKLFQLNCTYLTEPDAWINSPGYLDGDAAYARPIISGCLIVTPRMWVKKEPNLYATESLILGISCECHGQGNSTLIITGQIQMRRNQNTWLCPESSVENEKWTSVNVIWGIRLQKLQVLFSFAQVIASKNITSCSKTMRIC